MPKLPSKLQRPTLAMLPRVSDQLAFVYVNMARVERDDNGVHAVFRTEERGVERVYLPTASIAATFLGPGTSITQPASAQILRDGGVLILSGEAGAHFHGAVAHSSLTTKWLHLQAKQWADDNQRTEVAKRLYRLRFTDHSLVADKTIDQLRGMEGHRVKNAYRAMSQRHGIPFKRAYNPQEFDQSDPVNQALTTANQLLYGIVHSTLVAIGASPALGFIHTGSQYSFVYDIADLYKLDVAVPQAFASAKEDDPPGAVRRAMREDMRAFHLTRRVVADIQHVLDPDHQPGSGLRETDEDGIVHLWSPDRGPLKAGVNYGNDAEVG
ncbi:type I-E CRISPR-associated endonuclease Cas1e [Candidatus Poriferisocius sp.]|uniref:type I-E CRISPR-associated endonuclease Cas1e n=1 Tax=Candidatus Poriferisocius sp. TaxID=3101276 RepID=UPI003B019E35